MKKLRFKSGEILKRIKSEGGFALILVISVLLILTNAVVDLMYQTDINHTIAARQVDRLQALYLAKSGMNLAKLFMVYNKKVEEKLEKVKSNPAYANIFGGQPLYKMVPLNTAMLRTMLPSSSEAASDDTEIETSEDESTSTDDEDKYGLSGGKDLLSENKVGIMERKDMEDFLGFNGDFAVEIGEEQSKISLNAVTKMVTTATSYDVFKKILHKVLLQSSFRNYFADQKNDAETLTHAIFDYADSNKTINEYDKVEKGNEDSIYSGTGISPKNAKYLTTAELRLIPGMNDDIFALLEPMVTVYTTSTTVNVCLSAEDVLDALIVEFSEASECTTPIKEDEEKKIQELREVVLDACPDTSAMAGALYDKLGIKNSLSTASSTSTSTDTEATEDSSSSDSDSSTSSSESCKVKFENMITDSNDIFRFKATGTVNDVTVGITEVLDTSNSKPEKWKTYYYHVE